MLLFRKITLVFLTPTLMTVLFLSFIATFRISKEMFMLFGITNGSRIEKNNIKKFLPVFFKKIASVKDNITVEAKAIYPIVLDPTGCNIKDNDKVRF